MADRRDAIGGALLTTGGAAWIAALAAAAADPDASLLASLDHGASLVLLVVGVACVIGGGIALLRAKTESPGVAEVGVFRIEASPAVDLGTVGDGENPERRRTSPLFLRTIHDVRITNQQPDARLILDLSARVHMPNGRVGYAALLDAARWSLADKSGWLTIPVEVEPQRLVVGRVGFTSPYVDMALHGRVELEATDLVSGASVITELGEVGVAVRPGVEQPSGR